MARRRVTPDDVRAVVAEQPLVGTKRAAALLGIKPQNVSRLRQQERMPDPVPIEGTADVYVRSEIEALAEELGGEARGADGRRLPGRTETPA